MRVSLAQPRHPGALETRERSGEPVRFASAEGPRVVLGGELHAEGEFSRSIAPARDSLFAPRAARLAAPGGPLIVADTGHHRVLIWHSAPDRDAVPADVVLGQPDFTTEGRNAGGSVTELTCNVPAGVAIRDGKLAVADSWNHRVLVWKRIPERSGTPPDLVLGQGDRTSGIFNRGFGVSAADRMYWASGVTFTERGLVVADTGNRRVLVWHELPDVDGTPADLVLGQDDFATRDENGGRSCGRAGMRWPHDLLVTHSPSGEDEKLIVADAGNNRIAIWNSIPSRSGEPCDVILGQSDPTRSDHNGGTYWPTSGTLNMPYSCTIAGDLLVVADTANSRLLGWDARNLVDAAAARGLVAQPDFLSKGDNRWALARRDSICWPYGVSACDRTLVIADSGNSRVALWDLA